MLSEATVTLGGVYVALMPVQIWIWCCFCVVITRIITLLTGHTPKGDNRLSSMLNRPYYPFVHWGKPLPPTEPKQSAESLLLAVR